MQISPIQQNNTSFKAYFKQDSAGVFMDLYKKTTDLKRLEKATKIFKERCPNHELEIIGKDIGEIIETNNIGVKVNDSFISGINLGTNSDTIVNNVKKTTFPDVLHMDFVYLRA